MYYTCIESPYLSPAYHHIQAELARSLVDIGADLTW